MLLYTKHPFFSLFQHPVMHYSEQRKFRWLPRIVRSDNRFKKKPGGTLAGPQNIMPQNILTKEKEIPETIRVISTSHPAPTPFKRTHYVLKKQCTIMGNTKIDTPRMLTPRALPGFSVCTGRLSTSGCGTEP